jgi:ubiquinone biosynthesis protein Coq4
MSVPSPTYPDDLLLRQARDRFLETNSLRLEDYSAPTFALNFGPLRVKFLNTKNRKKAVPLHDLHHVLTGYRTSWIGEGEIGAWELRGGCNSPVLYWLNGGGVIIAMLLSPSRVWRAFRNAKGQRTLYRDPIPYDSLLEMTVGEVRRRVGIPAR